MAQTQLLVSWDAYQKNVCKGLSFMQERGEFVDMTLAAEGHYVKVHRMVLSLASPYIKELITSVDCPHPVVFLNNISYQTLCSILEYIYTGVVVIQRENLEELIQAGKALHIKGLINMVLNISYDGKITDTTEGKVLDNLNIEALETNDTEFNENQHYQVDTSAKEDLYSDAEAQHCENNDASMCEDSSVKLLEYGKVTTPFAKQNLPVTDANAVQYTMSNQGGLQLILNRYIYNMRYMSKNSSRCRWRCINYPRKMRCPAYLMTENDRVIERVCSHNHVFHDKLIMKKFRDGITFCTLKDAKLQMPIKKKGKTTETNEKDSM